MLAKTISEIEREYDFEIDKIVDAVKKINKKNPRVLLQFPDGLKPWADVVAKEIERRTDNNPEVMIWFGSCFGACDVPLQTEKLGVDLIVQFGHSAWEE